MTKTNQPTGSNTTGLALLTEIHHDPVVVGIRDIEFECQVSIDLEAVLTQGQVHCSPPNIVLRGWLLVGGREQPMPQQLDPIPNQMRNCWCFTPVQPDSLLV